MFLGRLTNEQEVKLVSDVAMLKAWYKIRSAVMTVYPDRKIWLLNRPVYDDTTMGFYLIESMGIDINEQKTVVCNLNLRGGMLLAYQGGVGKYVPAVSEMGRSIVSDFSITNILDFYFALTGVISSQKQQLEQMSIDKRGQDLKSEKESVYLGDKFPFLLLPTCVTSGFGEPRPGGRTHEGIDYRAKEGDPVVMPFAGKVVDLRDNRFLPGKVGFVEVETDSHRIKLMHVTPVKDLKKGADVTSNQLLGSISPRDLVSTAPHLHVEVRDKQGNLLNPEKVLGSVRPCSRKAGES